METPAAADLLQHGRHSRRPDPPGRSQSRIRGNNVCWSASGTWIRE
jgi:hypothetical protein